MQNIEDWIKCDKARFALVPEENYEWFSVPVSVPTMNRMRKFVLDLQACFTSKSIAKCSTRDLIYMAIGLCVPLCRAPLHRCRSHCEQKPLPLPVELQETQLRATTSAATAATVRPILTLEQSMRDRGWGEDWSPTGRGTSCCTLKHSCCCIFCNNYERDRQHNISLLNCTKLGFKLRVFELTDTL